MASTYEILLAWATINLIDEHLERVAGHDEGTQGNDAGQSEGDLEQLGLDSLHRRVDLDRLASDGVLSLMLPLKFGSGPLNVGNSSDAPLDGKIDFLLLPVLEEDYRPEAA